MLYGIVLSQTYSYYRTYPDDALGYKLAVAVICALETVSFAFLIHGEYDYLVSSHENLHPEAILNWSSSSIAQVFIEPLVIVLVQSFFAISIRILTPSTKKIYKNLVTGLIVRFGDSFYLYVILYLRLLGCFDVL